MDVELDRKAEWKQIFDESWRQMRDFFYDPDMHKVDWKGMYDKYVQLVPYVVHRSDLTYILSEMVSELNIGHAYVGGGEVPEVDKVPIGLLGATFELDKKSGFIKLPRFTKAETGKKLHALL
jgi:tricorn protease